MCKSKSCFWKALAAFVEGMNPKLIRVKLEAFVQNPAKQKAKAADAAWRGGQAPAAVGG